MLNNAVDHEEKAKSSTDANLCIQSQIIVNGYVRSLLPNIFDVTSNKDEQKDEQADKETTAVTVTVATTTEQFEDETQLIIDDAEETQINNSIGADENDEAETKTNSEDIDTGHTINNNKNVDCVHIVDINNKNNSKKIDLILTYYYDKLLLNTKIYSKWADYLQFSVVSQTELNDMIDFYEKLVELGYNPKRLPKYEMFRYYFGTSKDINRALNKWKGSIDTYSYYKLSQITNSETKECLKKLSKSCQFCGYHGIETGKPSPVFVLNYENWNWNDFDDLNHVIKASFYICCWMTDSLQAIENGITLMINCSGVRFHHIKKAMSLLRAIQKSLALRTNNVFFLNLPSLAKNSMKLFLKIYPKHIQDKIHVYSNTTSLFDILSYDQVPSIFGGSLDLNDNAQDNDLKSLATLLSSYVDIKDFKHFQIDDSDYDSDQSQQDEEEEVSDDDDYWF